MERELLTPADYGAIFKRRLRSFLFPTLGILLLSVLVAILLPPIYRSSSTILIEEQEIPPEYVMTTVTSFAEQRLQIINQRIMSVSRLLEIINRFNLYADLKNKLATEEIITKMRDAIKMETVNVDVVDRRTGRPSSATIAFTLSYEGKNQPAVIQQVATVLASFFLEENLKTRERHASETSQFFASELGKIKTELDRIDSKILAYKENHVDSLPEMLQVNIQSMTTADLNIDRLNEQLRSLKEREAAFQSQLVNISPEMPDNRLKDPDEQRLDTLRLDLIHLEAKFSDSYPDVVKTREELAALEEKMATSGGLSGKKKQNFPENPAYINVVSQLSSIRSEISSVEKQLIESRKRVEDFNKRLAATPRVEKEYRVLVNERDSTQIKYQDLMKKHMEAKTAEGLEREQKGERFTLIDPAMLPEKPFKPNRLMIILIGLVLGMGTGAAFMSFAELADDTIRSAEDLQALSLVPVLANIPEIVSAKQLTRRIAKRFGVVLLFFVALAAVIAAVHFFYMDLDVIWAKLERGFFAL